MQHVEFDAPPQKSGGDLTSTFREIEEYRRKYMYYNDGSISNDDCPNDGSANGTNNCGSNCNNNNKNSHKPPLPPYMKVYENHMPTPTQEAGMCLLGSKIYLFGGTNATLWTQYKQYAPEVASLGTNVVLVYDMKDLSVEFGPPLPVNVNHVACAASAKTGILYITGGYRQDGDPTLGPEALAYRRHWSLDTNIVPFHQARYETLADMPHARGAHGCNILADENMYCVGGAPSQWGPFARDLMIYNPTTDSWKMGPPMHDPRDHILQLATFDNDHALMVVGGRSQVIENYGEHTEFHPYYWTTSYSAEFFDIRLGEWKMVRPPSTPRDSVGLVTWKHSTTSLNKNDNVSKEQEETILLVGGLRYYGYSGHVLNHLEEYDPKTGLYHCHENLPFDVYGPAVGVYQNKLHILGGAEWLGLAATRRVVVVDLEQAPPARNCFYRETPIFDE